MSIQRESAARRGTGACGLVITKSMNTVFTPQGEGQYCDGIPVVTVHAKDEEAFLAFGDSSFLYSLKK